jgi:hypothetical protein
MSKQKTPTKPLASDSNGREPPLLQPGSSDLYNRLCLRGIRFIQFGDYHPAWAERMKVSGGPGSLLAGLWERTHVRLTPTTLPPRWAYAD